MKNINLFGVYFYNKRQEKSISLRELASRTGVSHTYLYNIEKGRKAPPNDSVLIKLADVLCLNCKERILWFDIAAKDNQQRNISNFYISVDILKYLSSKKKACEFIRKAEELNYTDDFWAELLKNI